MGQQGLHGGVVACQLGLGQQRVDLAVADAMQELRVPPALALGHQVVGVALGGRDGAVAEGADGGGGLGGVGGHAWQRSAAWPGTKREEGLDKTDSHLRADALIQQHIAATADECFEGSGEECRSGGLRPSRRADEGRR
jgi:hypothetical protein